MRKFNLQALIEVAIMAGLALILDIFIPSFKFGPSISISFAMVPVFLVAFRWGVGASFTAGLLWGILQIITGDASIVHPVQAIIEYFVAFAFIGFAGLFMKQVQSHFRNQEKGKGLLFMVLAILVGSFARYFWHFIAGFIFWAQTGMSTAAAIWFSFWANGLTMIGATVYCSLVLGLLLSTSPRLITQSINGKGKYIDNTDKNAS